MSLYIGKIGSRNVFHITNEETNLNEIKTLNPIESTIFHSDLPYIQPKKFLCNSYTVEIRSGTTRHYIRPVDDAINLILNGYEYIIVARTKNSNNLWVNVSTHVNISRFTQVVYDDLNYSSTIWGSNTSFIEGDKNTTDLPSGSNKYLLLYNRDIVDTRTSGLISMPYSIFSNSDVVYESYILILNIKNDNITSPIGLQSSNDDSIYLSKNTFTINNKGYFIDLSKFTYLKQINNYSTTDGFKSMNGSSKNYKFDVSTPAIQGWKFFPSSYDSSYVIQKKLTDGTSVSLFDTLSPLSTFMGTEILNVPDSSFGITTVEYNIGTIPNNYFMYAHITGTLKMSTFQSVNFKIKGTIRSYADNEYGIIVIGDSYSYINGVNRHSILLVYLGVFNGVIKVKVRHEIGYAGTGGRNSFSLTNMKLKIYKFYTKTIN